MIATFHFPTGKHYARNNCGTTDVTPQNSAEMCPHDLFSMHKHTDRSSKRAHVQTMSLCVTVRALRLLPLPLRIARP